MRTRTHACTNYVYTHAFTHTQTHTHTHKHKHTLHKLTLMQTTMHVHIHTPDSPALELSQHASCAFELLVHVSRARIVFGLVWIDEDCDHSFA